MLLPSFFLTFHPLGFVSSQNLVWYCAETEQGVAQAIIRSVVDFKRDPWPKVSANAKDLVKKMLNPDPKQRLTAEEVLGNLRFCLYEILLIYDVLCFSARSKFHECKIQYLNKDCCFLINCRSSLDTKCQEGSKCFFG